MNRAAPLLACNAVERKLVAIWEDLLPVERVDVRDDFYALGGNSLWWPAPDLHTTLEYQLINPNTGEVFYSAGAESTFWLAKWMTDASYNRYTADHGGNVPPVDGYVLEYRINGKSYPRW